VKVDFDDSLPRTGEYEELYGFLFLGILVHLVIDALVQETGVWV